MTKTDSIPSVFTQDIEAANQTAARPYIDRLVQRIHQMWLPGGDHFKEYMRHKWRMNHKRNTLRASFAAVSGFLSFCNTSGRRQLQGIVRDDLEAYIEHLQDQGLKVTTVITQLKNLYAFLRYLIDQDIIDASILKRKIKLREPDFLPRAIVPDDVRKILGAIERPRDRALVLILLRTGMRIGEVLSLTMNDIDLRDRKIHIYEGEKNCLGRVVYLSDDALMALQIWLKERDRTKEYLFYGIREKLCYSSAWNIFAQYLRQTGLQHKGYTIHSLRHTFASELLNAGMRLECLQLLLGHRNIEITRRYARLTDKSRAEEYFRAMHIIEQGGIHGVY
jgi:integrase/recombinase XerD